MNHTRQKRNLDYQSFEPRKMLAGDVTVVEDGHLYIRGDAADNQFEVVAVGDQLRVNGLQGTTINGQDSYLVAGATVTDAGVVFEGGLRAHLGPGSDDLMIQDAIFESSSVIFGGTGDDNIDVVDTDFMDRVVVQTYDGDDSISATRSHFEGPLYIQTLDGQDSVSLTGSVFAGDSFVVTGNHSDAIESNGNHYTGEVNLILPLNGNDTVQLNNPVVEGEQLGVFLGNGDDTINGDLTDATVSGKIRIGGQAGVDRVEMLMNAEIESQVSMATIEATGELVYANVANRTDLYGTQSSSKDRENNFRNFPATQIEFAEDTGIYSVSWAGAYDASTPNNNDRYVVTVYGNRVDENIFEGEFDLPDEEEIVFEAVLSMDDLTRVATGETFSQREGGPQREIFEFAADVEIQLEGGQQYWISIYQDLQVDQSDTAFAEYDNEFLWLSGSSDILRNSTYHYSGSGFLSSGEAPLGQFFELRS